MKHALFFALLCSGCYGTWPGSWDAWLEGHQENDSGITDSDAPADPSTTDDDGDGFAEVDGDCDDTSPTVHPGADEYCNDIDDDCDDEIDEDSLDEVTWYEDSDDDGYGDSNSTTQACDMPDGYSAQSTDCNDNDDEVHPGATETCNGTDDDCDTYTDEDATDASTWYRDADEDGYGTFTDSVEACDQPSGYTADDTDCDDSSDDVYPGADEYCNGRDDDCNGSMDDDAVDMTTYYLDEDGDGDGVGWDTVVACDQPSGYAVIGTDCDDSDPEIYPGREEDCTTGWDDNCNGSTNEGC